jgi:hypothetical protein
LRLNLHTFSFGESLIVVSPLWDSLVLLNSTARLIWELLSKGQEPDVIAGELSARFGISREKADEDVHSVLRLRDSDRFPLSALSEEEYRAIAARNNPPPDAVSLEQDRQPAFRHCYSLSNVPFCISFHSVEIESIIQCVLGHLEISVSGDSRCNFEVLIENNSYCLQKDGIEVGRETSPHSLRHTLIYEIAKAGYPDMDWLIFMHAGAVNNGKRCIVLPGQPGCGKSTITAALIQKGYDYSAEDIVPLSRHDLGVAPVPTRLCLREEGWQAFNREYPGIKALPGSSRWGKPLRYLTPPKTMNRDSYNLPVHCLVFPEYKPGQSAQISPLSSEETLVRLIQTGAWFSTTLNAAIIKELLLWIQTTPAYQLRYENLKEAASVINDLLHT